MQIMDKIRKEGADILGDILQDVESDSDESLAESIDSKKPTPKQTPSIESVGPPKILQYQPETKKVELSPPSPTLSLESDPIEDLGQFMKDFNVYITGGQSCEFCGSTTKKWPSIQEQEKVNPAEV